MNFTTTKDLEDYISDPLYKSDVNHTGVCMAIEHVVDKQHAESNNGWMGR